MAFLNPICSLLFATHWTWKIKTYVSSFERRIGKDLKEEDQENAHSQTVNDPRTLRIRSCCSLSTGSLTTSTSGCRKRPGAERRQPWRHFRRGQTKILGKINVAVRKRSPSNRVIFYVQWISAGWIGLIDALLAIKANARIKIIHDRSDLTNKLRQVKERQIFKEPTGTLVYSNEVNWKIQLSFFFNVELFHKTCDEDNEWMEEKIIKLDTEELGRDLQTWPFSDFGHIQQLAMQPIVVSFPIASCLRGRVIEARQSHVPVLKRRHSLRNGKILGEGKEWPAPRHLLSSIRWILADSKYRTHFSDCDG